MWSTESPRLLGQRRKPSEEKSSGYRVCPDVAQNHLIIPLSGIDYKVIIKHMAKGLGPKMGFSVPFIKVEN